MTKPKKNGKTGAGKVESHRSATADGDKLYIAQVRELVDLMVANDLTTLEIVNGELKVALGRGGPPAPAQAAPIPAPAPATVATPAEDVAEGSTDAEPGKPSVAPKEIKSPMVGTFYAGPSPESDPYVVAGTRVTTDTVVCLVEAMKVMSEIKAGCVGEILEIVAEDGQPVEYGQVLYRLKP
jgi:acetyl-CoA carboxylase biotin carboxyl carrier protein